MKTFMCAAIVAFAATAAASPAETSPINFFSLSKRASLPIPASKGTETLTKPMEVTNFDGGMKTYGRGVTCTGQAEGGDKDAVFIVKPGGSLSNVIIGKDQIEGVHCQGSCTITNVWWAAVCEGKLMHFHQLLLDTDMVRCSHLEGRWRRYHYRRRRYWRTGQGHSTQWCGNSHH